MALCDCSNKEELLQLVMAVSITEATAATPAPRVNIHGFPASGTPPANTHVHFPDASGADANDDDDEDDDDDDDDGGDDDDDDDNANNSPSTAGLFHGLLANPAIAAIVGQIPSPDPAAPVDTATTVLMPPPPPLDSAMAMHGHFHDNANATFAPSRPRRPALYGAGTR